MRDFLLIDDPLADAATVTAGVAAAIEQDHGICVEPSLLHAIKDEVAVATWSGYPTGKHHTLVKAAEARLAVQFGAEYVTVVPDFALVGTNAYMSELIAIREAVPHPAKLGVFLDEQHCAETMRDQAIAQAARCGFDYLVGTSHHALPTMKLIDSTAKDERP